MIIQQEDMIFSAQQLLHKYFGYKSFRPSQLPVVKDLLLGKDTVAIMPTGAGKSICFQVPSLLMDGVTLVISPLISLMKDQVDALQEAGIKANFLNSTLSLSEARTRASQIARREIQILYVAPERLQSDFFRALMDGQNIAMIAVDEAHCLSQWGHDFRPSYRDISKFIASLSKRPLIGAFTATATPEVINDIIRLLHLRNPAIEVSGFDRPNLHFTVLRGEDKKAFTLRFIMQHKHDVGIIYASTRKEVDMLYQLFSKKKISCARYHAGLPPIERSNAQDDFLYDRVQLIVATNAFGMGIDKSNVRYVLHYNMPQSLEAYYQEAGRAGRDGEPSECVLLYSSQDTSTNRFLIEQSSKNPHRQAYNLNRLQRMVDYCHTPDCLRLFLLRYFGSNEAEYFDKGCQNCSNCDSDFVTLDMTLDAQKVFSCIYRMHERFGVSLIAQVLKGSEVARVKSLGLDKLSTYGLYADKTLPEIRALIQRFLATDYLTLTDDQYPVVKLRPCAYAVLRNNAKVVQKVAQTKAKPPAHSALFEKLRLLRKSIAERDNVPPYIVFSDATLRDMCELKPRTLEDMLDVKGVGEQKLERYGKEFLDCLLADV